MGVVNTCLMCWNSILCQTHLLRGNAMRPYSTLVAILLAASFGAVQAQAQKLTPVQDRSSACERAAGAKKGDERRAFIVSCMAARSDAPQQSTASAGSKMDKMGAGDCGHTSAKDL